MMVKLYWCRTHNMITHTNASPECDTVGLVTTDRLDDMHARFKEKVRVLDDMALARGGDEAARLRGKAEGVRLSAGFLDELRREAK